MLVSSSCFAMMSESIYGLFGLEKQVWYETYDKKPLGTDAVFLLISGSHFDVFRVASGFMLAIGFLEMGLKFDVFLATWGEAQGCGVMVGAVLIPKAKQSAGIDARYKMQNQTCWNKGYEKQHANENTHEAIYRKKYRNVVGSRILLGDGFWISVALRGGGKIRQHFCSFGLWLILFSLGASILGDGNNNLCAFSFLELWRMDLGFVSDRLKRGYRHMFGLSGILVPRSAAFEGGAT